MTLSVFFLSGCANKRDGLTITNVSYDPTREFYEEYNDIFADYYMNHYGKQIKVIQSHGGSGSQARSVVEGCNADVVTLALEHDITLIENTGLIDAGWKDEYDKDSAPYTSTIVFLVRKGNPFGIKDWDDLTADGVEIITPDPKSSGGACWNFLAALSFAEEKYTDESSKSVYLHSLVWQLLMIMLKLTGQKSLQEHIFHICILRAHKDWQQNMATGHQIRIYYLRMVINLI